MPEEGSNGHTGRRYRYYDLLVAGFVAVLLCSNLIGPAKVAELTVPLVGTTLVFGAGNLFFPVSYVFGDVLTEVYGYARVRRAIWAGTGAMIFAIVMAAAVVALPVSPSEPFNAVLQPALETVFGNTWRVAIASVLGFWAGDFANAYVLAKMKIKTKGRWLFARTIGSTIVGQGVDTLIFFPVAFGGVWTLDTLAAVVAFSWFFKVMVEVVMTPVTYLVVDALKRAEGEDYYDIETDFTPFSLRDR